MNQSTKCQSIVKAFGEVLVTMSNACVGETQEGHYLNFHSRIAAQLVTQPDHEGSLQCLTSPYNSELPHLYVTVFRDIFVIKRHVFYNN